MNNSAKVLMVHDIRPEFLELDLSEFDMITFDDGLYSQYLYREHFLKFNKPLVYFISTEIVCPEDKEQIVGISCGEAHRKWFCNKDASAYMTWEQIKELNNTPGCKIGGHSHQHLKHDKKSIVQVYNDLSTDTQLMLNKFKEKDIIISCFAYPYNKKYTMYRTILANHDIDNVYGYERIAIESLLKGKE